jgi:peptidoglycan/xylan/chitin deacetylase (PgdA/CDA1 family)
MTLENINMIVKHFSEHGYEFLSPEDLLGGLPTKGKYCLLTFDDGYFNNQRILPILEENKAPALFFISSNHVLKGRSFWWDVIFRERTQKGTPLSEISQETESLKKYTHDYIESYVREQFGDQALVPVSDLDRPFTPSELRDFSQHDLVFIGNHTSDHALLTNYTPDQARYQIAKAQDEITEMIGVTPKVISYPNGNFTHLVSQIAREEGLEIGITVQPIKNRLPLDTSGIGGMQLGRFMPGEDDQPIIDHCIRIRSDVRLIPRLKALAKDGN